MKKYRVTLPVVGSVDIEVDANSEAEAIEAAFDGDINNDTLTYEAIRSVVSGNVCHVSPSRAYAEIIKEAR